MAHSAAMDALSSYLDERNERLSTFAVRIGRSPSTLSRALSGQRDPSVDLARDVEKGTQGSVTTLQFLEICLAAQAAGQSPPSEVAA
ncbi:helix-turn-helix domain-containing protein [Rhizobium leguminosarum]|uniref:helix-turn-helix domain-containing protein n=1 Tax=Rhizobium leguminosarum TaxID=384 RepID=UPI001C96CB5F|nr:helix-turn-helix transcriptional regulator [Rhizobium leguminosarum]